MTKSSKSQLKYVSPNDIRRNPENPRVVFRSGEMEQLLRSIEKFGIKVPLTVYRDESGFVLLDGERRWRCAKKLALEVIPAIIEERPSELQNLLIMYNIHALREQWDYFTIAQKLTRVIELYSKEHGDAPGEVVLSEITGLTRGAIRRCQLLIDLPSRFKEIIIVELEKPKSKQRLTEDFFIEMEKSLKSLVKKMPTYNGRLDEIRENFISKQRIGAIKSVTDFRYLSKIATAVQRGDISQEDAKRTLDRVFSTNGSFGLREAFSETVEFDYSERKAIREIESVFEFLSGVISENREDDLEVDVVNLLRNLKDRIDLILGSVR
jgi:ParB family chromosome partitioning protein